MAHRLGDEGPSANPRRLTNVHGTGEAHTAHLDGQARLPARPLPALAGGAPPTSLYSAASISSSCLSAAGRVTDGGMARRKKVSVVLPQKRSRTCIICCAVWISFVSRSLRMPSSGLSALSTLATSSVFLTKTAISVPQHAKFSLRGYRPASRLG